MLEADTAGKNVLGEAMIQYQMARQGDASAEEAQAALEEYRAERGHDRPLGQQYLDTDFVKLLRAGGATGWGVARHLFRNTAIPLLSLFFADMLGVLALNVFVLETC